MDTWERAGVLNKLYRLCYHFRDVPESAKIVNCHNESIALPLYDGWTAAVFKRTYQGRTVAIKVSQSTVSNCEATGRVSCTLPFWRVFSDLWARNSAKRR